MSRLTVVTWRSSSQNHWQSAAWQLLGDERHSYLRSGSRNYPWQLFIRINFDRGKICINYSNFAPRREIFAFSSSTTIEFRFLEDESKRHYEIAMNFIDFEYKRKFSVDIWKARQKAAVAAAAVEKLRNKLVLNEMEMSFCYISLAAARALSQRTWVNYLSFIDHRRASQTPEIH